MGRLARPVTGAPTVHARPEFAQQRLNISGLAAVDEMR
jgi:hypothetical protein